MLKIKTKRTKTEVNAYDELISVLEIAEERIVELQPISINTSKTKNRKEKNVKKEKQYMLKLWGKYKGITYM